MRTESDVRAEVWIAADRPSNRRAGGNHHGWRNRISVRATIDRVISRRYPARVFNLRDQGSPGLDASQRDGAIVQLGHFGGLLRRTLPEGLVLSRAPSRFRHHEPDQDES